MAYRMGEKKSFAAKNLTEDRYWKFIRSLRNKQYYQQVSQITEQSSQE